MRRYEQDGTWVYHLQCTIDDSSADLVFTGITQGFKIETPKESWTVALPKATVTGTITHNGKTLRVDGMGYHDHNWNYTILSALTYGKGWYWGKIKSNTFTIVWANVLKRSGYQDLLAIVAIDHNGFYNVDPANMIFEPTKYQRYKRRKIPSQISLSFKEKKNGTLIEGSFLMEVQHVHYTKVFFASYWRYHVAIKGSITVKDTTEHIDTMQIMEYLSMI
jgi:predicted secreted hydrolase